MKILDIVALSRALPAVFLLLPAIVLSEESPRAGLSTSITVRGRSDVTVTTPMVRLTDIAEIGSPSVSDDNSIIALQKLVLAESPRPGETVELKGRQILARLEQNGVKLDSIRYLLPETIKITRAARQPEKSEILKAIEAFLKAIGRDAIIKDVRIPRDSRIATGDIELSVASPVKLRPGVERFAVSARQGRQSIAEFSVEASLDEWREVAVSTRSIAKGSVLEANDLVMARMNISELPNDITVEIQDALGLQVKGDIPGGSVVRKSALFIPPMVEAGSNVTLIFRSGSLEASAAAVALDSGLEGEKVRVRNDKSKKVISGKIVGPALVEVIQ